MVKLVAVAALLLGACVADDATLPPQQDRDEAVIDDVELVDHHNDSELCGMAAELPASDVCSLICDPDAFKARLVDGGMKGGNCYQLRCTLSPEMSVTVGVCIP